MENSRNRNIVLWIILSFVTCGIASLVWMVKLNNDYRELAGEELQSGFILILSCNMWYLWICMGLPARKTFTGNQWHRQ